MILLVGTLWLTTLVALLVGALAWERRAFPGTVGLMLLMLSIGWASFCHSLGLLAPDLPAKLGWNHWEYLGAVWTPALLLMVALGYTRRDDWLAPWRLAGLLVIPAFSMAADWSNGWHHLYYTGARLEPHWGVVCLIKDRGPLYWLFRVYTMGSALASSGVLFVHWQRVARCYWGLSCTLLLAIMIPLGMNALYLLHLGPAPEVTLVYVSLLVTGLLLGWALQQGRLLESAPIARTVLMENMAEAVLVVDPRGWVTDFNRKAAAWFGCAGSTLGRPVSSLPGLPGQGVPAGGGKAAVLRLGERWISLQVSPLRSARGRDLGALLLCQDVTEQHQSAQALQAAYRERSRELQQAMAQTARVQEEEQRRIGVEIHDTLCQDLAALSRTAESLATRGPEADPAELAAELRQVAAAAAGLSRAARGFAHDLALADLGDLSLRDALAAFAQRAQPWLGVQVELNFGEDVRVAGTDATSHILRIVREAVVNAARHGQARRAWVDVVQEAGRITVSVTNDGRPLPGPGAIVAGMGLRGMRMRTRLLGGELTLQAAPGGMVTVQLELAEALLRLPAEERVAGAAPPP
ncbi:MAG: histidine kinase N-terminal 7TM domain-containing protein [Verrucomicrobiota bacterium]